MKENIALVVAILAILAAFMYFDTGEGYRVYDCGMAEWHPDIPNQVKEECRKLHHEEWKRQQEESKNNGRNLPSTFNAFMINFI